MGPTGKINYCSHTRNNRRPITLLSPQKEVEKQIFRHDCHFLFFPKTNDSEILLIQHKSWTLLGKTISAFYFILFFLDFLSFWNVREVKPKIFFHKKRDSSFYSIELKFSGLCLSIKGNNNQCGTLLPST